MNNETNNNEALASKRRKVLASFRSKTRVFDDYTIEVEPQAVGEPSQVSLPTCPTVPPPSSRSWTN